MATTARRRGYGDDSIYFDAANNCWTGAISLGYSTDGKRRIRRKITAKTKTEARDKLRALRRELDSGSAPPPPLGAVKLRDLTARQVQQALMDLSRSLSTRSLRLVHQVMERAIRHAQAADLVGRNVASLGSAPQGRAGRPSRSLTLDQAVAVLHAAESSPLHAYVVLSLLSGLRTEAPHHPGGGPMAAGVGSPFGSPERSLASLTIRRIEPPLHRTCRENPLGGRGGRWLVFRPVGFPESPAEPGVPIDGLKRSIVGR